jgi:hypothetical protein
MSRESGTAQVWRTIETAPQDGSKILLWARIHNRADAPWSHMIGRYDISFGWITASTEVTPIVPMYWMPLPNAPTG